MALAPGTRLGPYEIVAPLGAGGMGEVYRARDRRLGRDVAVKVLPADVADNPERLRRFEQEARAAAALNHPNILAVFDVGHEGAVVYLVTELLDGRTLRDVLQTERLSVARAIDLAAQTAQGLAAAHASTIVHRDLKPENLFVTIDGRVKILDFGLAKVAEAGALAGAATAAGTVGVVQTGVGVVLGTVGYMAPEQVRGQAVDARADIFAFGCVLYEMLSGQRAFSGATPFDTLSAIAKETPAPLGELPDLRVPLALSRIVERCLEKAPPARFQSAADLAFALQSLSGSGVRDASSLISVTPEAVPSRWRPASARVAWIVAAAAVMVAVAVAGVSYVRTPIPDTRVYRSVFTPPANLSGNIDAQLALSADGRRLAFTARDGNGPVRLWLRPLDSLTAQPIPGTDGAAAPSWSPDSRSLAFFAGGKLKRLDAGDGQVFTVCDANTDRPGTWSRDGVILFGQGDVIVRVDAAGGSASPVTRLDAKAGELTHINPVFLPDGRHFLYTAVSGVRPPTLRTYIGSLDSADKTLLLDGVGKSYVSQGALIFSRGAGLFAQRFDTARLALRGDAVPIADQLLFGAFQTAAFAVSDSGVLAFQTGAAPGPTQFVWFDRAGREVGTVGEPAVFSGSGETNLSPDGTRASVVIAGDVWIIDVARGIRTRFTFDPAIERAPVWFPDSRRVVFSSDRRGKSDLYQKSLDRANEDLIFADTLVNKFPESVSPDGRFISYHALGTTSPPNENDIWIAPLFGDKKPFPFTVTPFQEIRSQFSPDGHWMAYQSNESGKLEVYVSPFPGPGSKVQVSVAGGIEPRWRRDGKEIFYLNANKMMAATVRTDGTRFVVDDVRPLFDARLRGATSRYDVSADGQRFLLNPVREQSGPAPIAPITIVVNWPALLKH